MITQPKTKRGAASMYVVIFTAMLLSIIALSFVRIMLSEAQQTNNYSLSQSAYNSAMAGVEDAKVILLKYQNCQSTNNRVGREECTRISNALEAEDAEDNCDVIREARGITTGEKETLISSSETSNKSIESTAESIDQAYTCVKVNVESSDYIAKLNKNNSSKIIPVRVRDTDDNGNSINNINRIVVQWFSDADMEKLSSNGTRNIDTTMYRLVGNSSTVNITHINQDSDAAANYAVNDFSSQATVAPYLKIELFQTNDAFGLNQFYASDGTTTNRGTLTLRPTNNDVGGSGTTGSTHIGNTLTTGFAASAQKTYNFPMDVKCTQFKTDGTVANGESSFSYACTADIVIPDPVVSLVYDYTTDSYQNYASNSKSRNATTMFFRVSLPYRNPETTVRIALKSCKTDDSSIANSSKANGGCDTVNFFGVQPTVDSTGRAADLFRRVESRLEMVNTYFPYPDSALSVTGNVNKNFWVTDNCFSQTTYVENGKVITETYSANAEESWSTDTHKYKKCYNSGGSSK